MTKTESPIIITRHKTYIHVFDPIFIKNFFMVCGVNEARFLKIVKDTFKVVIDEKDRMGLFTVITHNNATDCGLIWSSDRTLTLMHECLHAAMWVAKERGIDIKDSGDEFVAYYQEFLFKCATGRT